MTQAATRADVLCVDEPYSGRIHSYQPRTRYAVLPERFLLHRPLSLITTARGLDEACVLHISGSFTVTDQTLDRKTLCIYELARHSTTVKTPQHT